MKLSITLSLLIMLCSFSFGQRTPNFDQANIAYKAQQYELAIAFFTKSLDQGEPINRFAAYYNRAYSKYHLMQYEGVKADIEEAFEVCSKKEKNDWFMGNSYWLYGRTYSKLGDKENELKYFKKADKYLNTTKLASTIGYVLTDLGKYKKAIKYLDQAINMDSKNDYAYSNRALVYLKLSEFEQAGKDADWAIRLNPANPYAFKHRAMVYIALEQFDEACKALQQARDLGYEDFGNESDSQHVNELMKAHCEGKNP